MRESERELAAVLIAALKLENRPIEEIDPAAPLFGDQAAGWGLDSIDALEIALAVKEKYGVELSAEDEQTQRAFSSLSSLTDYVVQQRPGG